MSITQETNGFIKPKNINAHTKIKKATLIKRQKM